jgi:hypothetical protein
MSGFRGGWIGLGVVLVLLGCRGDRREAAGPVGPGPGVTDGGVARERDAGELPDAARAVDSGPLRRCDAGAPFGTPVEVEWAEEVRGELYFVSSAWLDAAEERMIVTGRPRFDDGGKLYEVTRAGVDEAFGVAVPIPGVDVEGRSEWSGALSRDGLSLFFDVARREPYRATRASVGEAFSAGERIAPSLSTDFRGFVNVRPSAAGVYFEEQTSGFSSLQFLPEGEEYAERILDHGGRVTGYHVSADELTLYYSLVPPEESNAILYRTARASAGEGFPPGRAFELEPIVSFTGGHHVEWVSEDECILYVTVNKRDSFDSYPHTVLLRAERPL